MKPVGVNININLEKEKESFMPFQYGEIFFFAFERKAGVLLIDIPIG